MYVSIGKKIGLEGLWIVHSYMNIIILVEHCKHTYAFDTCGLDYPP